MAAFQRGIGLAEAQHHLEADHREPGRPEARHAPAARTGEAGPGHPPAPLTTPEGHGLSVSRPGPTIRHDGSAPAG
jgi:hypothetical protein